MFNYGWVVLVITVLLEGLSGFGRTASFSPFLKDVCRDLAVTSAQISFIYGLANLLTGIALPYIGRWYDRCPTKIFLRAFVTLFGSAFIGMSALKTLSAPPLFNLFALFCAFVAIRISVQSYMLTVRCMVAAWFKENRGFATGLNCLLLASVASSMPHLNLRLSRFFAWQHVWLTVGIFWLCVMFFAVRWIKKPPAVEKNDFDYSDKPKNADNLNTEHKTDEISAVPHEIAPENFEKSANFAQKTTPSPFAPLLSSDKASSSDISTHAGSQWNASSSESASAETFKTSPTLWLIMAMLFFKAFQMTALAFHLVPMCEAFGARAENVTLCLMGTPVITIFTTFIAGHFFEKIGIRNTLFLFLLLDISLLYSFQYIANNFILCMYGLTAGAYWGMRQILAYMVLPRLFGTKFIGTINGRASACLCLGSATGPYFFAKCHEAHSYLFALNLCQGFAVLLLLICLVLQKHFKPKEN
jgi:predicted MFS family arabinose efflux permease